MGPLYYLCYHICQWRRTIKHFVTYYTWFLLPWLAHWLELRDEEDWYLTLADDIATPPGPSERSLTKSSITRDPACYEFYGNWMSFFFFKVRYVLILLALLFSPYFSNHSLNVATRRGTLTSMVCRQLVSILTRRRYIHRSCIAAWAYFSYTARLCGWEEVWPFTDTLQT